MKNRFALIVSLGFSFSLPCLAERPFSNAQNRVELLGCMQKEGSFQWEDRNLIKEVFDQLRNFRFDGRGELPGQRDLFPIYEEKREFVKQLEAGAHNPLDTKLPVRPRGVLPDRQAVLKRNVRTVYKKRWKEDFPGATAFWNLMRQVEHEPEELAHHWQAIKALKKYLERHNVKTTVMEQLSNGPNKEPIGFKLVVNPSEPPFLHWASIQTEKLAQGPHPATLVFATLLEEARITTSRNIPYTLSVNLPALTAIDPFVTPYELEKLLYLIQQEQYREPHIWKNAWPRHILRPCQQFPLKLKGSHNLTVHQYHTEKGYSIETIGALLKKSLYLETLHMDGPQSYYAHKGWLDLINARDLAEHAQKRYDLALERALQNQLVFEYLGSDALYDKFRISLDDFEAIEIFSLKESEAFSRAHKQKDRFAQVLKELVWGYAWIADYSDLLRDKDNREDWGQRNLDCHPLF